MRFFKHCVRTRPPKRVPVPTCPAASAILGAVIETDTGAVVLSLDVDEVHRRLKATTIRRALANIRGVHNASPGARLEAAKRL